MGPRGNEVALLLLMKGHPSTMCDLSPCAYPVEGENVDCDNDAGNL
jgi:hypothetical protein